MEDVRRIELCALATREAAYLQTMYPAPADTVNVDTLARQFHEAYERLAPSFGYETRPESAVPWEQVPEWNRALMCAVVEELGLSDLAARARENEGYEVTKEERIRAAELQDRIGGIVQAGGRYAIVDYDTLDRLALRVAELERERDSALSRTNIAESHASLLRGKLTVLEAALRKIVAKKHDMYNPYHEALQIARAALAEDGGDA
jgi:hypothetical protein